MAAPRVRGSLHRHGMPVSHRGESAGESLLVIARSTSLSNFGPDCEISAFCYHYPCKLNGRQSYMIAEVSSPSVMTPTADLFSRPTTGLCLCRRQGPRLRGAHLCCGPEGGSRHWGHPLPPASELKERKGQAALLEVRV